jgi:hypothetical protein
MYVSYLKNLKDLFFCMYIQIYFNKFCIEQDEVQMYMMYFLRMVSSMFLVQRLLNKCKVSNSIYFSLINVKCMWFLKDLKDALLGLIVTITCILNRCNIENKLVFRTEILNIFSNNIFCIFLKLTMESFPNL